MPLPLLPTFFDGAPPVLSNTLPSSPQDETPLPVLVPKVGWPSRFIAYQGHHGHHFDWKARSAEQAEHVLLCASIGTTPVAWLRSRGSLLSPPRNQLASTKLGFECDLGYIRYAAGSSTIGEKRRNIRMDRSPDDMVEQSFDINRSGV